MRSNSPSYGFLFAVVYSVVARRLRAGPDLPAKWQRCPIARDACGRRSIDRSLQVRRRGNLQDLP